MIYSVECHTSEILIFVDHHLQLVVKEIPSYIKDTYHFIIKINFSVPVNSVLVTMDVKIIIHEYTKIYMSVPNNES